MATDMAETTPASQRRGSGISISLAPSNAVGGVITPGHSQNGLSMTAAQPMYPQGTYGGPMYMQSPSYPVLMNPPPMPTVSNYQIPKYQLLPANQSNLIKIIE